MEQRPIKADEDPTTVIGYFDEGQVMRGCPGNAGGEHLVSMAPASSQVFGGPHDGAAIQFVCVHCQMPFVTGDE